ncbi:MAG: DUF697 domain-containing protein [Candidatus Electrothrix sp. EH2]|nr:DUF697 domain-containing protein [Candidatus Electrothrix sp. EH2]
MVEKKDSAAMAQEAEKKNTANSEQQEISCESEACAKDKASRIIRNHMLTAMGVGLVPFPIVDMVGITGVQLNMLRRLSNTYEVPFTEHKVKNILASLIGGSSVLPIGRTLMSLVKAVPVAGSALGAISVPATAGAVTYAVGKVFHQHFASGGTFLTFDPDKVRDYYAEMLAKGKAAASAV